MNNKLLIIGAGQYSYVVKETALDCGMFSEIDFLDDNAVSAIGKIDDLDKFAEKYTNVAIAIGDPILRERLYAEATTIGYVLPIIIHPRAYVSPSAEVGCGTIIEAGAVVQANSRIGNCAFVSSGAIVRHNGIVGDFSHCDCNSVILSGSVVPQKTRICCGKIY